MYFPSEIKLFLPDLDLLPQTELFVRSRSSTVDLTFMRDEDQSHTVTNAWGLSVSCGSFSSVWGVDLTSCFHSLKSRPHSYTYSSAIYTVWRIAHITFGSVFLVLGATDRPTTQVPNFPWFCAGHIGVALKLEVMAPSFGPVVTCFVTNHFVRPSVEQVSMQPM